MMKSRPAAWCHLALCLCLGAVLTACGEQKSIQIGFIGGLSGKFADLGTPGRDGVTLAVEEVNTKGGIKGRKIVLVVKDDEHDPGKARQAADELIAQKVTAIIGPMTSAMAVAVVPCINESPIAIMGGTVVTTSLSGKDDNFLRAISTTREYAGQAARHYVNHFKFQRAAVVFDVANRDYAENWATDFAASFIQEGGVSTAKVAFDSRGEKDYDRIVTGLMESRPEVVAFAASPVDSALIAQKIRQKNSTVRFYGSGWAAAHRMIELGGKAVEGMLVEHYYNAHDTSPRYQAFVSHYRQRFGKEPDYASIVAYDAANIVLQTLEKDANPATLKQRIIAQGSFQGIQDVIRIDRHGDAERPAYFSEIREGKFIPPR